MPDDTKPNIELNEVPGIVHRVYGLNVTKVSELNSYDDRNYHMHVSNEANTNLSTLGYVFKVINSADTKDVAFFEGQNELLLELKQKKFSAPVPVKNISGKYFSIEKLRHKNGTRDHIVRLFKYQSGNILKNVPGTLDLYYQVGVWCARLNEALKDFHHPGITNRSFIWNFKRAAEITAYLEYVQDESKKEMVSNVIKSFEENVLSKMADIEQGTIHGDLNEQNILVSSKDGVNWEISSILDFGDVNHSCYLFDISAAICYVMLEGRRNNLEPLECSAKTLLGYQTVRHLSALEHSLLKITICTRLCQSLVLGLYTQSFQPDNLYVSDTQENGWAVLQDLWLTDDERLQQVWSRNTRMQKKELA